MCKVVLILVLLVVFGIVYVEFGDNQFFDCMDVKIFEMNN